MKENLCARTEAFWVSLHDSYAEKFPRLIEGFIYASFLTTILLSFPSLLGNPLIFAVILGFNCWLVFRLIPTPDVTHSFSVSHDERSYAVIILASLSLLLLLSLFTAPISSDGQRIKLARILMNIHSGSAWDVSRVDGQSTMYLFPSAFYLTFTFIEALHLPKLVYGLFNTALVIGSYLTVIKMTKGLSNLGLLYVLLFFAAPQIIFASLTEQEEALTLFLTIRAVYWLVSGKSSTSLIVAGIAGVLAVASKYSVVTFLPITTLLLVAYFSDRDHISNVFTPKHLLIATPVVFAIACLIFLPDILVSQAIGKGFFGQITSLSKYHLAKDISCWLPHANLRFFEMLVDYPNALLALSGLSISHLIPDYSFLPKLCSSDPTLLASYIHSDKLSRTSVQFGIIPFVAALSLFLSCGKERLIAALSIFAFVGMMLLFTFRFTYWIQTGRYFIVAYFALMPAFLICMQALASRLNRKHFHVILLLIAIPSMTIFVRSDVDIESAVKNLLKGDYYSRQATTLTKGLTNVTGPANIYFNDIMAFHSLLSVIPSQDVTLHKTLVANRTNIVAVPVIYNTHTNLHEAEWMLPIPDDEGHYVFIGSVGSFYGNSVPSRFFRGLLPEEQFPTQRFRLVYVPPEAPEAWDLAVLNLKISSVENTKYQAYFIRLDFSSELGICVFISSSSMAWYVGSSKCQSEPW